MVQAIRHELFPVTVDEFLRLSVPDGKAELVRGEVRMWPTASNMHSYVTSNLSLLLGVFVHDHNLGRAFVDGTGYELVDLPHTVRIPDLSFVSAERLPQHAAPRGVFRIAPDLAVEVLSPSETASDLDEKIHDYLTAGTRLVWIVDPMRRTIRIITLDAPVRWLQDDDMLLGGDVIKGFSCRVSQVFDGLPPRPAD